MNQDWTIVEITGSTEEQRKAISLLLRPHTHLRHWENLGQDTWNVTIPTELFYLIEDYLDDQTNIQTRLV